MRARSLWTVCALVLLVACGAPKREEKRYVEGLDGADSIVFGQAFFHVQSVEKLVIGSDPKLVYFVLPMQFSVQDCGGIVVHGGAALDTFKTKADFEHLHRVREGVFRKETPGAYLVVSPMTFDVISDDFDFTEVRIESGDLPCATAWLEHRLHRVRVKSESEIRRRVP